VTFGPGAFSSSDSEGFVHSGPYSLFTQATINFTGPGVVSFDSDLSTVPEPTSLLLLGSGLAGIGLWSRRKKKSAQV
jgi:PEP-CTERM motif